MLATTHYWKIRRLRHVVRAALMIALVCLVLPMSAQQTRASDNNSIADSQDRPYIEWSDSMVSAGIARRTTISAYAEEGELIYIGSSAIGASGDVIYYGPDGTTGSCGTVGRIANRAQEDAGPDVGFVPCVITAKMTSDAGKGIWNFQFISPDPSTSDNPTPRIIGQELVQGDSFTIAAWHVSVRDAAKAEIPGRVFARYLSYNMGGNSLNLDTTYWIVTNDGYGYQVDMNGIDPYGFIFFANAEGIINKASGLPIYRSLQALPSGDPKIFNLPGDYDIHNPAKLDNLPYGDITHKIFFESPAADLPPNAQEFNPTSAATYNTWLLQEPVDPEPQGFTFTGIEGTSGQAGTAPLGGNFTFTVNGESNYKIIIDVNGDGVFGTDARDRILQGRAFAGLNTVYWDALDGLGAPILAGPQSYGASIQIQVGEIHFPFIDPENNENGIEIIRFRGGQSAPDKDRIYYDDSYNPVRPYNYSLCAGGEGPAPFPGGCYGTPPAPRFALTPAESVASTGGGHAWSGDFGNNRVIDTWTYFVSDPKYVSGGITLAESDLSITKTYSPDPPQLIPGRPVTYIVQVTNAGLSPVKEARVADSVPAAILNVTWSCAITGVGVCYDLSGSGNSIDTKVDLNADAKAIYTIQGVLSPTAMGTLANTASVRRPNDNSDPKPSNNIATASGTIRPVADLELNKVISSPTPIAANSRVEFTITLRNRGPSPATGIEVREPLANGLSAPVATTSKGSYSAGIWTIPDMAVDEVATLKISALWDGSKVTNTAQVSASGTFDPDSEPDNGDASEDDQASASLPLTIADLQLTKKVNAAQVNVGSNVIFTIEVTNKGSDGATGVEVSERLPAGLEFVNATRSQGSYDQFSGTWLVGSLAKDVTASLQIEAKVLGVGPFMNVAQVSDSNQYDPNSVPNNDDPSEDDQGFAMVGGIQADLSLSKGVDNFQPLYNDTITYTLTLRNAGPSDATSVVVNDKLPDGLKFISATPNPSSGSYDSASGDWTVGTIASGASATLQIHALVATGSIVRNTAQVSKSDQPDPNSTPDNSDASEDDQASISLTPQYADLTLKKTVNDDTSKDVTVRVGGEATFIIAVTNNGITTATGVEVTEQLPAGLDYVSDVTDRGIYNRSMGIWTIGTINNGETVRLRLRVKVTGVGPYKNTAEVSKSDQPDPNSTPGNGAASEDDQDSATLRGEMADLSLVKRVNTTVMPADGIVTFTIVVRNDGPSPATNVKVTERLPAGATVLLPTPSKGSYTGDIWNVTGGLAVNESATLELRMQLVGGGPFANVAEITGSDQFDPDSTINNNDSSEDDQAGATVGLGFAPAEADLKLTKTAVTLGKLPGSAAFLITVENQGKDMATNVEVSEKLPPGLSFVSAAPSQGSYDLITGVWKIGSLPPYTSVTLNMLTIVTAPPSQPLTNSAQVSRSDQFDPDSIPGNGTGNGEDDQDSVTFSRLTAVTLASLRAERQVKGVLVSWATGVELHSLGFQVYRSATGQRADAVRVTPGLILARGGVAGASYSFLDTSAAPGVRYSYWLVEYDSGGATSEFGPVASASLSALGNPVYLPLVIR